MQSSAALKATALSPGLSYEKQRAEAFNVGSMHCCNWISQPGVYKPAYSRGTDPWTTGLWPTMDLQMDLSTEPVSRRREI